MTINSDRGCFSPPPKGGEGEEKKSFLFLCRKGEAIMCASLPPNKEGERGEENVYLFSQTAGAKNSHIPRTFTFGRATIYYCRPHLDKKPSGQSKNFSNATFLFLEFVSIPLLVLGTSSGSCWNSSSFV